MFMCTYELTYYEITGKPICLRLSLRHICDILACEYVIRKRFPWGIVYSPTLILIGLACST